MAEDSKASRRSENAFVAKVVTDPANPPDLARLHGYRGASSEAGHTRLYADADLSAWTDIPEGDVVYEAPVPAEVDPLGAVIVWIKRDAKIQTKTKSGSGAMFAPQPLAPTITQVTAPTVTPP